jgi:hypothetical protein
VKRALLRPALLISARCLGLCIGCGCQPDPKPVPPAPPVVPVDKEPSVEVQQLVAPIVDAVRGKDAAKVADYYRNLAKQVANDGDYAVQTTGELRQLHELSAVAFAKEHGLEDRFPGLSAAINKALADGLTLDDKPLDRPKAVQLLEGIAWACMGGSRYGAEDRIIEEGFQDWPAGEDQACSDEPAKIQALYESGYVGAWRSPADEAQFRASITNSGGLAFGTDAADEYGLSGTGSGKLSLPYVEVLKLYPTALPGPAQQRGDCVSHSTKNGCLTTLCTEVAYGTPDEVTGKLARAPEVSEIAMANGVLSTEAFYWYRGYSGDGWSCAAAASSGKTIPNVESI